MRRRSLFLVLPVFLAVLSTTGCVFRTRPVEDQYSKVPLKESSQQGLIDSINQQAESVHSLKATVDIDSSSGGMKKGHYTDYKEIRGYVLARKPDELHMIGLMPIVRTTAFDMVSDGQEFKLWIPPRNRFVTGKNQVDTPSSDQPMENIRPQNIYEALLIRHIDPNSEIAVLENGYETLHDVKGHRILQDAYLLTIIKKDQHGLEAGPQDHLRTHRSEAASAIHLQRRWQGSHRREIRRIQRLRRLQLPLAHRDLPPARGVRHHAEYAESGH